MRIENLKCLVDIAQTGSISATAQRMYISQQAVSKNIKHLEQELGVEVLIRSKTGVFLTEAGSLVVEFAKKVIEEEEQLGEKLNFLKLKEKEKEMYIEVWSTSSVTKMVLPDILAKVQAWGKKNTINLLQINDYDIIVQNVLSGEHVLALMTINEKYLFKNYLEVHDELEWETFVKDELVMVADKRYYIHNDLNMEDNLKKQNQIKTVYNLIPIEKVRPKMYDFNVICSTDADFHRSMMEQTGSITVMSGLDYRYYFNQKRYFVSRLKHNNPNIVHGVLYRKDAPLEIRNFVTAIRRAMQRLQLK